MPSPTQLTLGEEAVYTGVLLIPAPGVSGNVFFFVAFCVQVATHFDIPL